MKILFLSYKIGIGILAFNRPYMKKSQNDGIAILDFRLIAYPIMLTFMTYLDIPTRFYTELPDMDVSFST